MTKMADATFAQALELTAYTYIGLGVLGALVWIRDQIRHARSRWGQSTEADQ